MGELRPDLGLTRALAALGVLLAALLLLLGLEGLAVVAGVLGALVALAHPAWAVGLLLAVVVLVEAGDPGLLPDGSALYEEQGGLAPIDGLLGLATGAVIVHLWRRSADGRVRGERFPPLGVGALGLLALAVLSGVLVAAFGGARGEDILAATRALPYLVVVPLLVFCLLRTERDVRVAVGLAAALALLKAGLGLLGRLTERGVEVQGAEVAFAEPAGNALVVLVLLVALAALLGRVPVPRWILLGAPVLVLSLLLSERYAFWVGAALGLALVAVLAVAPGARRGLLPAAALVALGLWAVAAVPFQPQRASAAEPAPGQRETEERYRGDERANVLAELERRPLTGLGPGVPWTARVPLPVELPDGRQHVHGAGLWHWLKLGILGLAAYLALLAASARLAWLAWRGRAPALHRAVGLGALCWIVAMAVVETTGAFTGVDLRHTVLAGALLGVVAALGRAPAAG